MKAWQSVPFWIWLVFGTAAFFGLFSANAAVISCSLLLLPVFVQLLWRRGEPPLLVFACFMQWLQVTAVVFYANYLHMSFARDLGLPEYERVTWLGLGSLLALALGMRLALIRTPNSMGPEAEAEILAFRPSTLFSLYLSSFVVGSILQAVAFRIPALTQVILAFASLKWAFVFLLLFCVLERRQGYTVMAIAMVLEVGSGVLSYFAHFKSILFVLVVVVLISPLAFTGRRLFRVAAVALLLFATCVVWSAIKMQYRERLNQGTGEQVVLISVHERLAVLTDLILDLDGDKLSQAIEDLVLRVGYMQFFAMVVQNVPDNIPHEHGALWAEAVTRVLEPRLLFPDKEAINDSERTIKYTGLQVAGEEQGTSIGLGYLAESYIDFGVPGMFVPIFLLGVFYGLIYRYFVIRGRSKALGFALASAILIFGAYNIETANTKLVGGNLMAFLIYALLQRLFGSPFVAWAKGGRRAATPALAQSADLAGQRLNAKG